MTEEETLTCGGTTTDAIQAFIREVDEARWVARQFWSFIQAGCFLDDLEMGDMDSPEFDLWVLGRVASDLAYEHPWVREQEEEPPDA